MTQIKSLSPHERPPDSIRQTYKRYQKLSLSEIDSEKSIIDPQNLDLDSLPSGIRHLQWMQGSDLQLAFSKFSQADRSSDQDPHESIPVFTHQSVSGLLIIPSLFPSHIQIELLSRLFHRDLSNPEHQTNLHLHYDITYPNLPASTNIQVTSSADPNPPISGPLSFFQDDPTRLLYPKNPEIHKPISVRNVLEKKLRWVTLGGQYDWTAKVYPQERPPQFPEDITSLLRAAFPETEAQAAILNVYSPGDTLSPHRDVSEECDTGLISVSFGCDGLFLISHDNGDGCEIIRLRSGDAVYMNGPSRFAWHGVPKIISETCPDWLADWPCMDEEPNTLPYETWKGWMSGKRINLNVRQMMSENVHDTTDAAS